MRPLTPKKYYIPLFIAIIHTTILQQPSVTMPSAGLDQPMPLDGQQQAFPVAQQATMPAVPNIEHAPLPEQPSAQFSEQQIQEMNKQELDEINTGMQKIDSLKNELKKMLQELDNKFDDARKDIAEAKKMSFEILKKETEREARDLLDKVSEISRKIKETQNFAQNEFSTSFSNKTSEIKVAIAKIEGLVPTVEARIMQLHMTQAAPQQLPEQPAKTMKAPTTQEEKPSMSVPKSSEATSITTRIYNALSSTTATIIKAFKDMVAWIIEPTADNEGKKKLEIMPQPQAMVPGQTVVPGMGAPEGAGTLMPGVSTPMPGLPTLPQPGDAIENLSIQARAHITTLDEVSSQLDHNRLNLDQQYQEIKQVIKNLTIKLDSVPLIKKYLDTDKTEQKKSRKEPRWKKVTLHVVSKFLDLVAAVLRATVEMIRTVYNYFFAPSINQFTHDVKTKLIKLEEQETKKRQPQPALPVQQPIVPLPQTTTMPIG